MNHDHHFITDVKQFRDMQLLVGDVFRTSRELPEQVFRNDYSQFVFGQFDWAMEPRFWLTLQKLAQKTQEDFILMGVLKPHPVEYFYREFNCLNWVKLPIHLTEDEYWERLESGPTDSPADAILYNSFTVVWVPPSKKWAIWGDRGPEICVLGFKRGTFDDGVLPTVVGDWKAVHDQAVKNWISLSFINQEIPDEFFENLSSNYSS